MVTPMTQLLDQPPYATRDDDTLLHELVDLTRWHLAGCEEYRRVWPAWVDAADFPSLPFLHVSGFKHVGYRTTHEGLHHHRVLTSSSTTGASPSRISLDDVSSELQSRSTTAILRDFIGDAPRPLVVLDDAQNLRKRNEVSARIAAALGLRSLTTEIHFVVNDRGATPATNWHAVASVLEHHTDIVVYGFTWMLWAAWAALDPPAEVAALLERTRVAFVHSGGWKRMEANRVDREMFDAALLRRVASGSQVVDYYGLVEQIGVVFPLCSAGVRHVPRWAYAVVRDPWTLAPTDDVGLLQLLNPLAKGAPYHSVLTEDLAKRVSGLCACGRSGEAFELIGRLPKSEARGCADA
jgi:hypothetical protein